MKNVEFSKNSWHYRLANFYGNLSSNTNSTDICSYTKSVACGLLVVMAATLISGLVLSFVVTTCLGLVVSVMYWTWLLSEAHSIALLVCVASGVWIFFIWVTEIIIKMRRYRLWKLGQSAPVPEPGFTKLAYASIKDKYCIKVTIKE